MKYTPDAADAPVHNEDNSNSSSKSLLRQSMTHKVLTGTERSFLESLLAMEGSVGEVLCGEAMRRLCGDDFDDASDRI